ncbi:MAG: phosphatidylglycerol lysyltransferase domain-containing protein [Candidatus Omnitrophota bacterium]
MDFKELRISDRGVFQRFLNIDEHYLSAYHFVNIFIWGGAFRIFYAILNDCLCVFFKDKNSCFMYLPPLGDKPGLSVMNTCFAIMDDFNANKNISRIENVGEKDLDFFKEYGFEYYSKPGDYLCGREDIISLKGNRFKSKRASYNYFIKHYGFEYRPFLLQDADACLALYCRWAKERRRKFSDSFYQAMLDDSFLCQKAAMENFFQLGLFGSVVRSKEELVGYTFGFPLSPKTFCVLFEICNLTFRGVSQFIFTEFCRQLPGYQHINIMDDSGLLNLRRVKLSYCPVRIVPNYIVRRKGCE